MTRRTILYLVTTVSCGLLFVNIYTSIVDAVNWGNDIPASIKIARDYFKSSNPGIFFRIFSPVNQILALLAVIVCWKAGKKIRMYCLLALAAAVSADVLTFAYFYPRNDIMFVNPIDNIEIIKSAWSDWTSMNWVRSGIIVLNIIFNFTALTLLIENKLDSKSTRT